MKLLGATPSPFYRKARVFLEEKGIPYEPVAQRPFPKTPELLAMHPMGKIPILKDGGLTVPDSSVICAYLEKLHPSPALYPSDPAEYARALFLEEYADSKIVAVVGGIFFERFVKPNLFEQETDEAEVSRLKQDELPGMMDYLESQAPESGDHIASSFGIADIALGAHMGGLHFAGETIDAARWPKTKRYIEAVLSRPSFKTAMSMS